MNEEVQSRTRVREPEDDEEDGLADYFANLVSNNPTTETEGQTDVASNKSDRPPAKKKRTQVLKPGKRTSEIWDHFVEVEGTNPLKAKCIHCGDEYLAGSKKNGTSSLWSHIRTRCKKYPLRLQKQQTTLDGFSAKEDGSSVLTFSLVEGQGFRHFIKILEPRWTLPCRITVAKDCFRLYEKEKAEMKVLFKDQRLSLTTNCWTSLQNLSYLTLTAHFIDKDWKLQKRILNFVVVENHKGDTIGRAVEACMVSWGFDKVFTITVDNASSNGTAIDYLKCCNWRDEIMLDKYLHVRCSAHIINLIVKEGLKEQSTSIHRIRLAVRFVRSSPQRSKKFQQCVAFEKIDCKKGVCLDVETRWNSTYLMLEIAVKYRKTFDRLKREDSGFVPYFESFGPPDKTDWAKVEAFVKFLKLFYDSTLALSGSNYVTCAQFFVQIVVMHLTIKRYQGSKDITMKKMADNMRGKFEKYWIQSSLRNNLLLLGVVFDPRYKFKHVEFCFEQIYGADYTIGKQLSMDIKFELEELVKCYMDMYASRNRVDTMTSSNAFDSCDEEDMQDTMKFLKCQFKMKLQQEESVETRCELTRYLNETCENEENLDILQWWKMNSSRYPVLSIVAKDVLAISVFTVASEQSFSTGGRILNEFRSSLQPNTVEMLICAQNWLRVNKDPIDMRQIMEDIEKFEALTIADVDALGSSYAN